MPTWYAPNLITQTPILRVVASISRSYNSDLYTAFCQPFCQGGRIAGSSHVFRRKPHGKEDQIDHVSESPLISKCAKGDG